MAGHFPIDRGSAREQAWQRDRDRQPPSRRQIVLEFFRRKVPIGVAFVAGLVVMGIASGFFQQFVRYVKGY